MEDRRRYPRRQVRGSMSVELRVQVGGDKPAILLTRGVVADISCGGLKCEIDLAVPVGTVVKVCFTDLPEAVVAPELSDGHVVRTESLGGVPDNVAIAFTQPLERIDVDSLMASSLSARVPRGRTASMRRASWADEPRSTPGFATGNWR
jgi:hypothetical protein